MSRPELPVRFGVIGCGALARQQHLPTIARSPRMELRVCCDLDEAALETCRARYGVKEVTRNMAEAVRHPEVDAICLATIEDVRREPIALAAEAGKPVYVEKPLAPDLAQAYAIRGIVQQAGIPFCVGHNRRSSPAMLDAHRIYRRHMDHPRPSPWRYDREGGDRPRMEEEGVPGFVCRINDDWYSWKGHAFTSNRQSYGPMLYEMTHFVDLANWFLDAEPVEVTALEPNRLNHAAVIAYDTGALATIAMSGAGTFGYPKELYEITGNAGMVVIDHMLELRLAGIEGEADVRRYPPASDAFPEIGREGGLHGWLAKRRAAERRAAEEGTHAERYPSPPDKGHANQLERFVDEIRGQGPVVCGIDDAILATEVCFAAIEAAHQKQAVAVNQIRENQTMTTTSTQ